MNNDNGNKNDGNIKNNGIDYNNDDSNRSIGCSFNNADRVSQLRISKEK